jgi:L-iditol 2-dehydrogenase
MLTAERLVIMQQVILIEPGKIEIRDVPVPEPSEGEIVVRVNIALTCGTDLKAYVRGHKLIPMPGPFGHEYSGTVAKTGKGITDFKEGDNIMGVHSAPCMECGYCKKGLQNLCEVIMKKKVLGAFSEYILLPVHIVRQNLFHKPQDISFEEAALLEPFSCVVHPYSTLKLDKTETALVIGAGPIGLMHLAYLKIKGVKVIVSDYYDNRLILATNMGADRITVPNDTANVVKEVTDDIGVDLVMECTGQQSVWEKSVNYVRRGGAVVLFGGCPAGTQVTFDAHKLHYNELSLQGSFHYKPQDVLTSYQALKEKKFSLSKLISGEFPLKDLEKAFTLLKEGKGIKYALKP